MTLLKLVFFVFDLLLQIHRCYQIDMKMPLLEFIRR